jgi:hypothetical protein
MDGGGRNIGVGRGRQPSASRPDAAGIVLTAELVARAVIAAAGACGDDPVKACTCHPQSTARRSLSAAAAGLHRAGATYDQVERVLGVKRSTLYAARSAGKPSFVLAETAAMRAAEGRIKEPPLRIPVEHDLPMVKAPAIETVEPGGCAPPVEIVRAPRAPIAKPAKLRTLAPAAVRREILGVLAPEPCTAPDLAEILSLSEAAVRQGLRELAEAHEVAHDALTAEGWRVQTWRLPR